MAWDHCGRREPHPPHPYTAYFNEGPYALTCGGTARPEPKEFVPMEVADERTLASLMPGAEESPAALARRHAEERAQADAKAWIEEVAETRAQREDTLAAIEDIAFGRGERVEDWPEDEREAFRAAVIDHRDGHRAVQRLRAEKILKEARHGTER